MLRFFKAFPVGALWRLLVFVALIAGAYLLYQKLPGAPEIGQPLICPSGTTAGVGPLAGFCYANCPEGMQSDGASRCYKPCPSGWPGGETVAHCQHKVIYSTVGADPSQSIPNHCGADRLWREGLCYDVPKGWHVTSPGFIGKICPDGWRDDGTTCWQDMHSYGRGFGYALWEKEKCEAENGACEQTDLMWYPVCRPGYVARGCCICERPPRTLSKEVRSQIGSLPDGCPQGRIRSGRLCYPACPQGFERRGDNLEFCSTICQAGFTNIGVGGCQKPSADVTFKALTDVGVCPPDAPVRKLLLCFKK